MTMHSGTTPFAYIFFTIRPSLWTILYSFLTCYQMAVPLGLHFIHFSLATIRLSLWNYILFISHLLLPNGRPFGTIFYSISHATIRPSLWDYILFIPHLLPYGHPSGINFIHLLFAAIWLFLSVTFIHFILNHFSTNTVKSQSLPLSHIFST